jgi:hypothetical protein
VRATVLIAGLLLSCIPSSRGALGAGLGLSFAMMMLSVTGPPPEVFTDVTRSVANVLPLTYVVRVLQPSRRVRGKVGIWRFRRLFG